MNDAVTSGDVSDEMKAALAEIRREGRKVAVIYAIVDAAFVLVTVLLASALLAIDAEVGLPPLVYEPLASATGIVLDGTVEAATFAGAVAAMTVFIGEYVYRTRRPIVEQFEAANPIIRESLRTARDAVQHDVDTTMARRLYADVLDRLRETSSLGLVDLRRVGGTLAVTFLLGMVSMYVIAAGIGIDLGGGASTAGEEEPEYEGLQDADQILGEATDVQAGENREDAVVGVGGEGDESGDASLPEGGTYESPGSGPVDAEHAGFEPADDVEDAELIRDYNVRIRQVEAD